MVAPMLVYTGSPRRPHNDMRAAATRQTEAEQGLTDAADLAMRHAGLLVEFDDRGPRIGTEVGRGGTKRVGCL
jgi:hypothetical protein